MAEVGSFSRFGTARALMSYCGLVPSEHSSGGPDKAKRGGITKTGHAHLRRVLGEASWHYRLRPRVTAPLARRQAGVSPEVKEIAWKAQHRLHTRFLRLQAKGKAKPKAAMAVARELLGFLWDIGGRVEQQHQREAAAPRRQAA